MLCSFFTRSERHSNSRNRKEITRVKNPNIWSSNPEIPKQLNFFIIDFQEELKMRWYKEQQELQKNSGKDLDNLINVE